MINLVERALGGAAVRGDGSRICIILNTKVATKYFDKIWGESSVRICADGAANRLFDMNSDLLPDVIIGDLDSVRAPVLESYRELGVIIEKIEDQNSTDFGKALAYAMAKGSKDLVITVFCGMGGRLDQVFGLFTYLYKYHWCSIYLVSADCVTFTVKQEDIIVDDQVFGPSCGLIPLISDTRLSTRGLKWDLDDTPCHFGEGDELGMVSTNNLVVEKVVKITATKSILFTIEFKD
jgi:thiamine pyrophosphokinase